MVTLCICYDKVRLIQCYKNMEALKHVTLTVLPETRSRAQTKSEPSSDYVRVDSKCGSYGQGEVRKT